MAQAGRGDGPTPLLPGPGTATTSSTLTNISSSLHAALLRLPAFARELIAGGVAGGLAKTAVAPLERTKIIMQTRGVPGTTVRGVLADIWATEGLAGLFRGNTASVMRIVPYAALHFGSYEYFRRAIVSCAAPAAGHMSAHEVSLPLWDLLAGSASGATAVVLTYPLDLVRTRLAWATEAPAKPGAPRHHAAGIWCLLRQTLASEGVRGLYRGVNPTVLGILPYAGLKFYVYQSFKNQYRTWHGMPPSHTHHSRPGSSSQQQAQHAHQPAAQHAHQPQAQQHHQHHHHQQPAAKLPIFATLLFGGVAGLVAQTVTYPLDVIRRQMQVSHLRAPAAAEAAGVNGRGVLSASNSSSSSHAGGANLQQSGSSSSSSSSSPAAAGQAGRLQAGPLMIQQLASRAQRAAQPWASLCSNAHTGTSSTVPPGQQPHATMVAVAARLWAQGGPRAFTRGLSLNFVKVVPSTAIGFTVYDMLKASLGLSSSL